MSNAMDSIDDLPLDNNSSMSPDHKSTIEKYVGAPGSKDGKSSEGSRWTDSNKWKTIGFICLAFLAIANPIVQKMLDSAPYIGGNNYMVFGASLVIFAIIILLVIMLL